MACAAFVGVDEIVDQSRLLGVQPPAAQFFQVDLFPMAIDTSRGRETDRRSGLSSSRKNPRSSTATPTIRTRYSAPRTPRAFRACGGTAKYRCPAAPHAARPHGIGQARAGRFAGVHKGMPRSVQASTDIAHFARIGGAGGRALGREVVHHHADVAAVDAAEAHQFAVARRSACVQFRNARMRASTPSSMKLLASTSLSRRSCAFRSPPARRLASFLRRPWRARPRAGDRVPPAVLHAGHGVLLLVMRGRAQAPKSRRSTVSLSMASWSVRADSPPA